MVCNTWEDRDIVIKFYFASRKILYEGVAALLLIRIGDIWTKNSIRNKIERIRNDNPHLVNDDKF